MINITKRNLPHWTSEDTVYFITFNLHRGALAKDEQIIEREHIISGNKKFYDLYALIVMPDHVHLILKPNSGYMLSRITKGIKGVSANKINKIRNTSGQLGRMNRMTG